jgi:Family of unknown function (DUF5715)
LAHRKVVYVLLFIVAIAALTFGAWTVMRLKTLRHQAASTAIISNSRPVGGFDSELWMRGIERVKEDRVETGSASEVPPELRHYSDRHWFLATQVAEVRKFNLQSCEDFVDLGAMIVRGEMVSLPAVTDNYILYGVGAKADKGVFSKFVEDQNIALYDEAELRDEYGRLASDRAKLEKEISDLRTQLASRKNGDRRKPNELQKEIATRQEQLKAIDEEHAGLDQAYGRPDYREKLLRDYESLKTLAASFGDRAYNLSDSSDRYALKIAMLCSLRPAGLKILEEIARLYHDKFDRPLPISSLVRPEQYQHTLRKANRNAVIIDTPPHSTGLAFDIDYRYMTGAEQSFLMTALARMKHDGRIEVIRERNSNYHVFAFIDGKRPDDDLITASLDAAGGPMEEASPTPKPPARIEAASKSKAKKRG